MKLNLGCGAYPIRDGPAVGTGWENWDEAPDVDADRHLRVPPIPLDTGSVDEIYMGHLLEHLTPYKADRLLHECKRVLVPGGRLGVVVPDTRRVLTHYLHRSDAVVEVPEGQRWNLTDLDAVCAVFLYSTVQPSPHRWSYDRETLCRTLERAGFRLGACIDPFHDPRHSVGAWWNLGQDAFKPEAGR